MTKWQRAFGGRFWGTLAFAFAFVLAVGLTDPVGGRVLCFWNVAFVLSTPVAVVSIVAVVTYFDRPVKCSRCGRECRFSRWHSECGRKRWQCLGCDELRDGNGEPI